MNVFYASETWFAYILQKIIWSQGFLNAVLRKEKGGKGKWKAHRICRKTYE